jgi:hypothetical protein
MKIISCAQNQTKCIHIENNSYIPEG